MTKEKRSTGVYQLSEEELADIEEGLKEIERGEVASDEEVAALFNRYRAPGIYFSTKTTLT
jgi:predicted transcriptional regulator